MNFISTEAKTIKRGLYFYSTQGASGGGVSVEVAGRPSETLQALATLEDTNGEVFLPECLLTWTASAAADFILEPIGQDRG